jgi:Spy/CpxP family protein refolding chaperone
MEKMIDPLPEQRDEIHEILLRHSLWVKQFSEEQRAILQRSIDSLDAELARVLTPEQMKRFQEKVKNQPRRPGPPPGPPPPPFEEPRP